MTRRLVFRPEAETELTEAVDWYEARSLGLGAEFLRSLDATGGERPPGYQPWFSTPALTSAETTQMTRHRVALDLHIAPH